MKKFIIIGFIFLVIFCIYFYYKEHLVISGREVEKQAENHISSICTVNKHEEGLLWNRDVKIKVNRVKAKLFDSSYLAISCNLDVKWQEGAFFFSGQPTISGYGKLVQIRDKIYIVDINFTKIDILNNSPLGNFL